MHTVSIFLCQVSRQHTGAELLQESKESVSFISDEVYLLLLIFVFFVFIKV